MIKRIGFTIWAESEEEARDIMHRLYRKDQTWVDHIEKDEKLTTLRNEPDARIPVSVRPNVSPGEPSIGKIGKDTKAALLADIAQDGSQPVAKWAEHMKLLWKRGEVKFDGEEYYL